MDKEVSTDVHKEVRELPTWLEGKIWFTIRADDTEGNQKIHDAFKAFAKEESNNDYTMALKNLLEFYQYDYKTELLHDLIKSLEERVAVLEATRVVEPVKEEEDKGNGTF